MKKRSKIRIALVIIILCAILLPTIGWGLFAKKKKTVVFIPKLIGIPWFNSMEKGLKDYAKEAGGLQIVVSGAPEADPAQQARILEDAIARKPDCIIVVPNDTRALEPIMKKGLAAGITMITQEAATAKNVVCDIEFLNPKLVGKDYMEALGKATGGEGGYAIMVGGLTVESHNARADSAIDYQKDHFPKMFEVTSRVEGSESVEKAHDKTLELIQAYPNLKGILYIGSLGGVGGAIAVEEKNLADKIAIIGTSVPSQAKQYLAKGTMRSNLISNPYLIGKDTAYIVKEIMNAKGDVKTVTKVPNYGTVRNDGKVITFHSHSEVTAENADSFGF